MLMEWAPIPVDAGKRRSKNTSGAASMQTAAQARQQGGSKLERIWLARKRRHGNPSLLWIPQAENLWAEASGSEMNFGKRSISSQADDSFPSSLYAWIRGVETYNRKRKIKIRQPLALGSFVSSAKRRTPTSALHQVQSAIFTQKWQKRVAEEGWKPTNFRFHLLIMR